MATPYRVGIMNLFCNKKSELPVRGRLLKWRKSHSEANRQRPLEDKGRMRDWYDENVDHSVGEWLRNKAQMRGEKPAGMFIPTNSYNGQAGEDPPEPPAGYDVVGVKRISRFVWILSKKMPAEFNAQPLSVTYDDDAVVSSSTSSAGILQNEKKDDDCDEKTGGKQMQENHSREEKELAQKARLLVEAETDAAEPFAAVNWPLGDAVAEETEVGAGRHSASVEIIPEFDPPDVKPLPFVTDDMTDEAMAKAHDEPMIRKVRSEDGEGGDAAEEEGTPSDAGGSVTSKEANNLMRMVTGTEIVGRMPYYEEAQDDEDDFLSDETAERRLRRLESQLRKLRHRRRRVSNRAASARATRNRFGLPAFAPNPHFSATPFDYGGRYGEPHQGSFFPFSRPSPPSPAFFYPGSLLAPSPHIPVSLKKRYETKLRGKVASPLQMRRQVVAPSAVVLPHESNVDAPELDVDFDGK